MAVDFLNFGRCFFSMATVATLACCGSFVGKEDMYWRFWEVIVQFHRRNSGSKTYWWVMRCNRTSCSYSRDIMSYLYNISCNLEMAVAGLKFSISWFPDDAKHLLRNQALLYSHSIKWQIKTKLILKGTLTSVSVIWGTENDRNLKPETDLGRAVCKDCCNLPPGGSQDVKHQLEVSEHMDIWGWTSPLRKWEHLGSMRNADPHSCHYFHAHRCHYAAWTVWFGSFGSLKDRFLHNFAKLSIWNDIFFFFFFFYYGAKILSVSLYLDIIEMYRELPCDWLPSLLFFTHIPVGLGSV